MTVRDGRQAEFEAAFAEQAAKVRELEPGNQLYRLFRSPEAPQRYMVMEIYADETALRAHAEGAHLAATRAVIAALGAAPPRITRFDAV
jgi:quinol monooxygenase YgiN